MDSVVRSMLSDEYVTEFDATGMHACQCAMCERHLKSRINNVVVDRKQKTHCWDALELHEVTNGQNPITAASDFIFEKKKCTPPTAAEECVVCVRARSMIDIEESVWLPLRLLVGWGIFTVHPCKHTHTDRICLISLQEDGEKTLYFATVRTKCPQTEIVRNMRNHTPSASYAERTTLKVSHKSYRVLYRYRASTVLAQTMEWQMHFNLSDAMLRTTDRVCVCAALCWMRRSHCKANGAHSYFPPKDKRHIVLLYRPS